MCIEFVVYDQLQAYLEEVPDDVVAKWTPKQVIDALLDADPHADKTVSIAVGIEETPGVAATNMTTIGDDRRFSRQWANKHHNALGNFLHAPTLEQLEKEQIASPEQMTAKAKDIIATLTHILESPLFRVNFGEFLQFTCSCGAPVKSRTGSFRAEDGITCRNTRCSAVYDPKRNDDGSWSFTQRQAEYKCHACKGQSFIGAHLIRSGQVLRCECGAKAVVGYVLKAVPTDTPSASG